MIYVDRNRVKPPAAAFARAARRAKLTFSTLGQSFEPDGWIVFRDPLRELFRNKCAYCESNIDITAPGVVDQFRPKRIYWWLAYEWDNLLYACQACNRYKADRFPALFPMPEWRATPQNWAAERPLLLDPCEITRPQDHLAFQPDGTVVGITEEGRATIEVVGLNRDGLVHARHRVVRTIRKVFELQVGDAPSAFAEIQALTAEIEDDSFEYAGFSRQILNIYLRSFQERLSDRIQSKAAELSDSLEKFEVREAKVQDSLSTIKKESRKQRSYSIESEADADTYNRSAKRIERIELQNFRGIEELDLRFPEITGPYEPWLMLIGENGVCKSSILQGVALALMGQKRANKAGLDARRALREDSKSNSGFVRVHVSSVGPIELKFSNKSDQFTVDPPLPKVPLLGFGATRLLPRQTGRAPSKEVNIRVDNLFDPTMPLSDAQSWLLDRANDRAAFREVEAAVCELLMLPEGSKLIAASKTVEVKTPNWSRPIAELSDGYQSMLALAVDIAIGTSGHWSRLAEAEGIVLLDEIEVHLHPHWKISIVERLRKVFPRLAFLATTHDPLCLKGLRDGEIVVLRRDENRKIYASTDVPSVDDLRTDEILTSELFDLPSTRNSASPIAIARYSSLLGKTRRTKAEEAELLKLREQISSQFASALTPMQREVEAALIKTLEGFRNAKISDDVLMEVRRRVAEMGSGKP